MALVTRLQILMALLIFGSVVFRILPMLSFNKGEYVETFEIYPHVLFNSTIQIRRDGENGLVYNNNKNETTTVINRRRVAPIFGSKCPQAVQSQVGLFDTSNSNSSVKDNFRDVVLLVSSNYAFYNMLQNWEYLAQELNIKWAVLALDDDIYDELGPERAIAPGNFSVSGRQGFRKGEFGKLACNKMRMVQSIAQNCDVDIVFTDVDNIFFKNPFEHDFGRLIESQVYEYIYQSNFPPNDGKAGTARCLHGKPRNEGNTGFYFFNRKSELLNEMFQNTLRRCEEPKNKLDDQKLFWEELWKINKSSPDGTFHHCDHTEHLDPSTVDLKRKKKKKKQRRRIVSQHAAFNYCCLDPYFYPTGKHDPSEGPINQDPITYHANWALSYEMKVQKLVFSRWDRHGWNESRFLDKHGGLLGKMETIH
jgi:hypothetical protein